MIARGTFGVNAKLIGSFGEMEPILFCKIRQAAANLFAAAATAADDSADRMPAQWPSEGFPVMRS